MSLNVEPEIRFALPKHLDGFVQGGAGWLHRAIVLTTPSVQTIDYFDPFYGEVPQNVYSTAVLSSTTRNAFGGNFGGGVALPIADTGAEVYVDVRYYYAPTSPRVTTMIPVIFGVRYTSPK